MKLSAVCNNCDSDQLLIPEYGDENQMLRCAQCDASADSEISAHKRRCDSGDVERNKELDDFYNKLDKVGFK